MKLSGALAMNPDELVDKSTAFTVRERPRSANPDPIPKEDLNKKNRYKQSFKEKLHNKAAKEAQRTNRAHTPQEREKTSVTSEKTPISKPPTLSESTQNAALPIDDPEKILQDIQPVKREQLARLVGTRDLETVQALELQLDFTDTAVLESLGQHCPELTCLVLDGSKNMESFRDLGLGLRKIQTLSLAKSGITELDGIGILEHLRELRLAQNDVQDLTPLFMHETLQVLDLTANKVEEIRAIEVLATCPVLYSLDFRRNPIETGTPCFREVVAHHIPQLRVLDDRAFTKEERQSLDTVTMAEVRKAAELRQRVQNESTAYPETPILMGARFLANTNEPAWEAEEPELGFDAGSHLTLGPSVFAGSFSKSLRDKRVKKVSPTGHALDIFSTLEMGNQLSKSNLLLAQWQGEIAKGSIAHEGSLALPGKPQRLDPLDRAVSPKKPGRTAAISRLDKKGLSRPHTCPDSPGKSSPFLSHAPNSPMVGFSLHPASSGHLVSRTLSPQSLQASKRSGLSNSAVADNSDWDAQLRPRSALGRSQTVTNEQLSASRPRTPVITGHPALAWTYPLPVSESEAGVIQEPKLLFALDWASATSPQTKGKSMPQELGFDSRPTDRSEFCEEIHSIGQKSNSRRATAENSKGSASRPMSAGRPVSRGVCDFSAQRRAYVSQGRAISESGSSSSEGEESSQENCSSDEERQSTMFLKQRKDKDGHGSDNSGSDSDIDTARRNMKRASLSIVGGSAPATARKRSAAKACLTRASGPHLQLNRCASRAGEVGKQMGFDLLKSLAAIDEWIDHTVGSTSEDSVELMPSHPAKVLPMNWVNPERALTPAQNRHDHEEDLAFSPSENTYFDEEASLISPKHTVSKTMSQYTFKKEPFKEQKWEHKDEDETENEEDGNDDYAYKGKSRLKENYPQDLTSSPKLSPKEPLVEKQDGNTIARGQKASKPEQPIGLAVQLSDQELIEMLQKPPSGVRELRTKEKFRSFFYKFPAPRLRSLLQCAYADLEPKSKEEKIKKRFRLVEDILEL